MPQTTATLQTPPGKGGIAVIALVGPGAAAILDAVFRPRKSHGESGQDILQLGHLVCDGQIIDEAVVCRRPWGAEINIHGGPAAARAALRALARHGSTVLPAETSAPRAFPVEHPRWRNPAVGVETLSALADAGSSLVVQLVSRQWSAGLSRLARQTLDAARPGPAEARALRRAAGALPLMRRLLHPPELVLAGPPNAGKSTLANALAGREMSIVHPQAGTTRDWVRELALVRGVPIWLTDTAGLWNAAAGGSDAAAEVDAESVRRARARAEGADLVLLLGEGSPPETPDWLAGRSILHVAAKCDVRSPHGTWDVRVSAHSGEGMEELRTAILRALGLAELDAAAPLAFTPRQAGLLGQAADALEAADAARAAAALRNLLQGATSE